LKAYSVHVTYLAFSVEEATELRDGISDDLGSAFDVSEVALVIAPEIPE